MTHDNISQSGQKAINKETERLLNTKQSPTICYCGQLKQPVYQIEDRIFCSNPDCRKPEREKSELEPTSNTEELKKILEDYATYCYYEGDPKRGGVDLEESLKLLTTVIETTRKEVRQEEEKTLGILRDLILSISFVSIWRKQDLIRMIEKIIESLERSLRDKYLTEGEGNSDSK